METILIIFVLSIQSSYAQNSEFSAVGSNADTVQFFIESDKGWRIRTFAVDQDVHAHSFGAAQETIAEKVISSTERIYGDVIARKYIIHSSDGIDGIKAELKKLNLTQNLEISKSGFSFWTPENTQYTTKTQPK